MCVGVAGGRDGRGGWDGAGGAEVHNQKQEPQTKMWGKTFTGFPA